MPSPEMGIHKSPATPMKASRNIVQYKSMVAGKPGNGGIAATAEKYEHQLKKPKTPVRSHRLNRNMNTLKNTDRKISPARINRNDYILNNSIMIAQTNSNQTQPTSTKRYKTEQQQYQS
jgi:hypothetical protein